MDDNKTPEPSLPDATFLSWIADRLVGVYGESPNVDFVRSLRERIERIKSLNWRIRDLLAANNRYLQTGRDARHVIGLAHARLSHVLVAMMQAQQMKVELSPLWFTEKVREVAQLLQKGKPDDEATIGAGSCQKCHENAAELCRFCNPSIKVEEEHSLAIPEGVMSGRDGGGLWEVRAYYSGREEADAAHTILARPSQRVRS